jgi:hypothetical protein
LSRASLRISVSANRNGASLSQSFAEKLEKCCKARQVIRQQSPERVKLFGVRHLEGRREEFHAPSAEPRIWD